MHDAALSEHGQKTWSWEWKGEVLSWKGIIPHPLRERYNPAYNPFRIRTYEHRGKQRTYNPLRIRTCRKVGGGGHSSLSGTHHSSLVTTHYVQVLSFQTIPHSFALFCTYQKLNPFVFMQFRTLCEKHPGEGEGCNGIPKQRL